MPFVYSSDAADVLTQMSDDERLSLTTAVSDEDETGEPRSGSRAAGGGAAAAASFNCTGAVRKAGFLSVKKWLLRRRHQARHLHCSRRVIQPCSRTAPHGRKRDNRCLR
ncbi:hypothetical protein HPB51_011024 [Rhipicephalus microplus]|uniref:Uncharacterized protein n=1 Tax=Rhipicephalus microplus TaxID=6941 RepID=A0A9J6DGB5_RHIMP|nr:hypothetical protein HPB51_011024 [Rhipicephalus microplus]